MDSTIRYSIEFAVIYGNVHLYSFIVGKGWIVLFSGKYNHDGLGTD